MNIPLDNLYHWIQGLAQHPVMLYVFRPHGSKDIFDLDQFEESLIPYQPWPMTPLIVCHDQEPLDFNLHQFDYDLARLEQLVLKRDWTQIDLEIEMEFYNNLSSFPNFKPN